MAGVIRIAQGGEGPDPEEGDWSKVMWLGNKTWIPGPPLIRRTQGGQGSHMGHAIWPQIFQHGIKPGDVWTSFLCLTDSSWGQAGGRGKTADSPTLRMEAQAWHSEGLVAN